MDKEIEQVKAVLKSLGEKMGTGKINVGALVQNMEPVFAGLGFRKGPAKGERPRILVVRDDAAGDFVLFSPFLRELRRLYPTAHITLLASPRNHELALCCPYVDNVLLNDLLEMEGQAFRLEKMGEIAEILLPYRFHMAFSARLGLMSMSLITAYVSGAALRIGFTQDRRSLTSDELHRTGWNVLLTRAVPVPDAYICDVDRNLSLLESMLELPIANRELELWYTAEDRKQALEAIEPLVAKGLKLMAVVPGASMKMKEWPVERYAEFVKGLMEEDEQLGILVMGGPAETEIAEKLAAELGDKALNLAGKFSFRASAAAMGEVSCYVGNDTALMHFAAAQKKPVLVVLPYPANLPITAMSVPCRYRPYGVPAVAVISPQAAAQECRELFGYGCAHKDEHHCIKGVTVEKVRKGWNLLQQRIAAGEKNVVIMK